MDFNNTVQMVTFNPSTSAETAEVTINFFDDAINEADEGFLVVVRATSNQQNVTLDREGVASVIIINDDRECIVYYISPSIVFPIQQFIMSLMGVLTFRCKIMICVLEISLICWLYWDSCLQQLCQYFANRLPVHSIVFCAC